MNMFRQLVSLSNLFVISLILMLIGLAFGWLVPPLLVALFFVGAVVSGWRAAQNS